jgi:hypothetical protein
MDHGTLNEWANGLIFEGVFARDPEMVRRFQDELTNSPVGQAWLNVSVPIDNNKVIRFRGKDFPVSSIAVTAHAISAKAPIEFKHYELMGAEGQAKLVTHLEATAGGKKFNIVIPHVEGGHADHIVVKIDDARPSGSTKNRESAPNSGRRETRRAALNAAERDGVPPQKGHLEPPRR